MATVAYRNGRAEVRFYDASGKQRRVSFGKIPKRLAESHAMHIEALANARRGKFQAAGEHFEWAGQQVEKIQNALAAIGLIPQPERAPEPEPESEPEPAAVVPTIEAWFTQYIAGRPGSESSRKVWNRAKNQVVKHFGADRLIDSITTGDAIGWFEAMQRGKGKLAVTTARKMVGVARQVFKRALKSGHIEQNPFHDDELPTSVAHREKEYVDLPTIQSVLAVLPSAEWRAVIIFARFAGLRVQSELPLLKWADIDEEQNLFAVFSPKTRKSRRVPLFPEIRQALDDLRPITGDGEYVLKSLREKSNNWRTPLEKMLTRAGITPWAPIFNCLRSSAEIDIARTHGLQCATEWVGNSVQVAMKHYVRSTAEDFSRAAESKSGLKIGLVTAGNDRKPAESGLKIGLNENAAETKKRRKPNKKRGSEQNSEPRSMVPTGLATIGTSATTVDGYVDSPSLHNASGLKFGLIPDDNLADRFQSALRAGGFTRRQVAQILDIAEFTGLLMR